MNNQASARRSSDHGIAVAMTFRITFGTPEDVTNLSEFRAQWVFPFTIVNTAFIGMPEEISKTEAHRIFVPISRFRLAGWDLNGEDLVRVLFEYGKRHVIDCVTSDELPATEFDIHYPEIFPETHPQMPCPFNPNAIRLPDGVPLFVERP